MYRGRPVNPNSYFVDRVRARFPQMDVPRFVSGFSIPQHEAWEPEGRFEKPGGLPLKIARKCRNSAIPAPKLDRESVSLNYTGNRAGGVREPNL
jgi:hypothetical protein